MRRRLLFVNAVALLVAGRLTRGRLRVGIQTGGRWTDSADVDEAGDFTIVIAPTASGVQSIVLAADGDIAAVLNRIDLVPPMRPAH